MLSCFTALAEGKKEPLAKPEKTAEKKDTDKGRDAVSAWLALADAGDSGKTWETAGAVFKSSVSKEQWKQALAAARAPLGKLVKRELKSATLTHSLPGVPPGDYVVTQWEAQYANNPAAIETATASLEKDGGWHVVGYFIK